MKKPSNLEIPGLLSCRQPCCRLTVRCWLLFFPDIPGISTRLTFLFCDLVSFPEKSPALVGDWSVFTTRRKQPAECGPLIGPRSVRRWSNSAEFVVADVIGEIRTLGALLVVRWPCWLVTRSQQPTTGCFLSPCA